MLQQLLFYSTVHFIKIFVVLVIIIVIIIIINVAKTTAILNLLCIFFIVCWSLTFASCVVGWYTTLVLHTAQIIELVTTSIMFIAAKGNKQLGGRVIAAL